MILIPLDCFIIIYWRIDWDGCPSGRDSTSHYHSTICTRGGITAHLYPNHTASTAHLSSIISHVVVSSHHLVDPYTSAISHYVTGDLSHLGCVDDKHTDD